MAGENRAKARRKQAEMSRRSGQPTQRPPKTRSGSTNRSPAVEPQSGSRNGAWWLVGGVIVAVAIAVVAIVALSGGGGSSGSNSSASKSSSSGLKQTQPVNVSGTPQPQFGDNKDAAVGKAAPVLTGKSFDGSPVTVPVNGKPTMIVFGAHWCPHCQREFPEIVDWLAGGGAKNANVVAVATGTNADAPNYPPSSWLDRIKWPDNVMADSGDATAAQAYGLPSYPFIVFVKADGTVAMRTTGEVPTSTLDEGIAKIAST
jgi:thiol-disulfide isomerase/thioredoxin